MARNYQKWPIYPTKRMVEIIPYLCSRGEKHTVVANILFHCLGSSNSDTDYNTLFRNDYIETLYYLYNNRSKLENLSNSHNLVKEIVFCPFNMKLISEVSPSIYPSQKDHLISSLEESLQNFSMYYTNVKENIDLNLLFASVGTDFVKIIKLLRLDHKLNELNCGSINEFFNGLINGDEFDRIKAMELLEMLLKNKAMDLFDSFVPGSLKLVDILISIVEGECKKTLEIFFKIIPKDIQTQAIQFLRSTDPKTGLLLYDWGFNEADLILSGGLEVSKIAKTGEDNFSCKCYESFINNLIVNNIASLYSTFKKLKDLNNNRGTKNDNFNDFKSIISVHFEPDIVVISTQKDIFIIDTLIKDPLYISSLFNLLNFIWSSNLVKVGHGFMLNVAKLSCHFNQPFKKYNNIVDLNDKRVKKDRKYKDDSLSESSIFKSTGFSKSLCALLQEYNVPLPERRRWNNLERPVSLDRIKYLSIVSRGMLAVEYQLRSQGWMPSSTCDNTHALKFDAENSITLSMDSSNTFRHKWLLQVCK